MKFVIVVSDGTRKLINHDPRLTFSGRTGAQCSANRPSNGRMVAAVGRRLEGRTCPAGFVRPRAVSAKRLRVRSVPTNGYFLDMFASFIGQSSAGRRRARALPEQPEGIDNQTRRAHVGQTGWPGILKSHKERLAIQKFRRGIQYAEMVYRMQSSVPGIDRLHRKSQTILSRCTTWMFGVPGTFVANAPPARKLRFGGFVQTYHQVVGISMATLWRNAGQARDVDRASLHW